MSWQRLYPLNDSERRRLKQARDKDYELAESGRINALRDGPELSFEEDLLKTIAISQGAPRDVIPELSKNVYGKPLLCWQTESV